MAARHLGKLQFVALSVSRGRGRRRNAFRRKRDGPREAPPRWLRRNRADWNGDAAPWGRRLRLGTLYFPDNERTRGLSRHGTQLAAGAARDALLRQRRHLSG